MAAFNWVKDVMRSKSKRSFIMEDSLHDVLPFSYLGQLDDKYCDDYDSPQARSRP